uniref:Uncharacterized protein n=1 Tax=Rangifer tarandus platyrhynchus TaxID=3082113 RepID=A0ACB0FK17_RANTA|nr:unnamed protein product [Rangifer tarandus platyrhynchus]
MAGWAVRAHGLYNHSQQIGGSKQVRKLTLPQVPQLRQEETPFFPPARVPTPLARAPLGYLVPLPRLPPVQPHHLE